MARKKIITSNKLVAAINAYAIAFPNRKITANAISQYLSETAGMDVGSYLIRRDKAARALIDEINEKYERNDYTVSVPVFHPINVDMFLKKNCNVESLKQALTERDQYYSSVVELAGKLAEKSNELEAKVIKLDLENQKLRQALKRKINAEESKTMRVKDSQIKALKKALEDYVYPAAADMILVKCGFMDADDSIIDEDKFNTKTVEANSEIQTLNHSTENMEEAFNDTNGKPESEVDHKSDSDSDPIANLLKGFD